MIHIAMLLKNGQKIWNECLDYQSADEALTFIVTQTSASPRIFGSTNIDVFATIGALCGAIYHLISTEIPILKFINLT